MDNLKTLKIHPVCACVALEDNDKTNSPTFLRYLTIVHHHFPDDGDRNGPWNVGGFNELTWLTAWEVK
jgi:hypothetical protein